MVSSAINSNVSYMQSDRIRNKLTKLQKEYGSVFSFELDESNTCVLDFSSNNQELTEDVIRDAQLQEAYVKGVLNNAKVKVGVGGYLEERVLYQRSTMFESQKDNRNVHLGIDLWAEAFTDIHAPLAGQVFSIKDNVGFGNYGPTVILKHQIQGVDFYTLYGHLDHDVFLKIHVNDQIDKGQAFCQIGNYPKNGDWAPHLHFQLMIDLSDYKEGDYPGVCSREKTAWFSSVCLDPNIILQIPSL